MRVQHGNLTVEFPAFCQAVGTWLRDGVCLDPALAAVVDLVDAGNFAESELARVVAGAADTHAALGAGALLELVAWSRSGDQLEG